MVRTNTHSVKHHKIRNTCTNTNGGYVMYFKLFAKLIAQVRDSRKLFGSGKFTLICFGIFFKSFWWCIIKPLGQFVSSVTKIEGDYRIVNGEFYNDSLTKWKSWKLFGIYIFGRSMSLNDEDIKELTK